MLFSRPLAKKPVNKPAAKAKTAAAFLLELIVAATLGIGAFFWPPEDCLAAPQGAFDPEARAIMEKVYRRPDGADRRYQMTLTLTNQRGAARIRRVEIFSKDYGPDRKSVMSFSEPADVKGTIYLSWDYGDAQREDDRWLYLPSMRKDRRVSGKARSESFMGTDFAYGDLDRRRPEKDVQKLLGEEKLNDLETWVIECRPAGEGDGYARKVAWVSKEDFLIVKAEYYDQDGLLKVYEVRKIERRGPYSAASDCVMRNVVTGHRTEMLIEGLAYDTGLSDELFTVAYMRRGRL
ncbi:MAG: outer membrane lipoprotein-sorting protein [Deltaproteobacteria bacterium]|nr:outer membrane lipoprotein-sorting protein [Deltaproteobacteria bacterium]